MREEIKDRIEAGGAWMLESVASAVPVIGGPMAIAINKTIAAAESRRVQAQIAELQQLLESAVDAGRISLASLESDEFIANLHFVVRQLQETNEKTKRDRLKRALVTSAERKWVGRSEQFTRIIARLEESHVLALSALFEIAKGKTRTVRNGTLLVLERLSGEGFHRSENYYRVIFEQLAGEALVVVYSPAELAAQIKKSQERRGSAGYLEGATDSQRVGAALKLTSTGSSFIHFLRRELEEVSVSTR